ncbi:hypothetical protein GRI42_10055 [Erythrobacter gaetbuli]|uniref:Uncharacterized protein n=1 Tax=Qipengyuania gaetbuli TaxID=266952 RepID=A0A844Y110_9SPHN|nr:hypothetical protein [Qipengyuania gaetbuli]MXO51644.1 hypothetical protein [Qipengyuania gaetbuli]
MSKEDQGWFAPKRYGYGAGLPIAWQGWALLIGYIAIALSVALLIEWDAEIGGATGFAIFFVATIALMYIAKAKTRGGWKWRWGGDD